MGSIHAVFENGVFRPFEPIDLPEKCEVVFEPRIVQAEGKAASLDDVYLILGRRFNSGQHDVAERHNEHQP